MNVYAVKMAAVFQLDLDLDVDNLYRNRSTLTAFLGYLLAAGLLIGSYYIRCRGASRLLPLWVFLISIYILLDNLGPQQKPE